VIPTVSLAKRMQEEARQRGIAVTLDELYQHVVPHGLSNEP
jgi:aryl carrier-like protein